MSTIVTTGFERVADRMASRMRLFRLYIQALTAEAAHLERRNGLTMERRLVISCCALAAEGLYRPGADN